MRVWEMAASLVGLFIGYLIAMAFIVGFWVAVGYYIGLPILRYGYQYITG